MLDFREVGELFDPLQDDPCQTGDHSPVVVPLVCDEELKHDVKTVLS